MIPKYHRWQLLKPTLILRPYGTREEAAENAALQGNFEHRD
jgi:hypothetical protein